MILGIGMPLPDVSHQAIALLLPFHGQPVMKVGHALKEKPEAPVPERGFGRFDNLQMLTANVAKFASLAVNRPKLINPRRKTLTHHFSAHPPVRIHRHARQTHRPPTPPPIYSVQHAHHFLGCFGLRDRKKVIRVFAFLAKVKQEHLGLAVFETGPENSVYRFLRCLCHQTNVVSRICPADISNGVFFK